MRPEEIRSRGVALAERVRAQVDTAERLEIMLRAHRRSRIVSFAAATAVVLAVVLGVVLLARVSAPPVVTVPPTTVPPTTIQELRSLPVEVFMVLSVYTVNEATGACEGSGPLAGIGEGSVVHVFDESTFTSADDAPTITLPAGVEVTQADPRAPFMLGGDSAGCVFVLPDLGYDITEYENITLFPEADPDVSTGRARSGQRVVFSFGDSP